MRIDPPADLRAGGVALRVLRSADARAYAGAFRDDPGLGRLLGFERDPDHAAFADGLERNQQRAEAGTGVELAIAGESDEFLGTVALHSVSWPNRRAELGIWVIPDARRRGVGASAVALAVSWAFERLDLLRLEMTTTPENAAVPGLARRLGFTQEGVLRARNVERGQRVDIIWFGLLREEWPPG